MAECHVRTSHRPPLQSQFQPLKQRDAGVALEQWMLCCRECSLGFHLNLSNAELQQCFFDARCGISDTWQREQSASQTPRALLNLQQFAQCLVFVVSLQCLQCARMSIAPR